MQFEELSYAAPDDPPLRRGIIRTIETLSGRGRLEPLYDRWRRLAADDPDHMMTHALDLLNVTLDISGPDWPPPQPAGVPLVLLANHPFGIGDGLAALAMAEALGRPYKVFVHSELMKVPELRRVGLPIDFDDSREALRANLRVRAEARDFLHGERTLVVFPAGEVATARWPFAKAPPDAEWKNFTARLVLGTRASILPVYFEGRNSALFQVAARASDTLRSALLVSEFIRRIPGGTIRARTGRVVRFDDLVHTGNAHLLTAELRDRVLALGPPPPSAPAGRAGPSRWTRSDT